MERNLLISITKLSTEHGQSVKNRVAQPFLAKYMRQKTARKDVVKQKIAHFNVGDQGLVSKSEVACMG